MLACHVVIALLQILGSEAYKGTYNPDQMHATECKIQQGTEAWGSEGWEQCLAGEELVKRNPAIPWGRDGQEEFANDTLSEIIENIPTLECH